MSVVIGDHCTTIELLVDLYKSLVGALGAEGNGPKLKMSSGLNVEY